jgi:phosphoketolase
MPLSVPAIDAMNVAACRQGPSAGQIDLLDNPLLRERLRPEHVKPRLLGHWGTTLDRSSGICI